MSVPLVIGKRQTGKTQVCVEFLLEHLQDGLVIVLDQGRRHEVMLRVAERTSTSPHAWNRHVVTMHSLLQGDTNGIGHKEVWIDQADHILFSLLRGHHLNGVTWDA